MKKVLGDEHVTRDGVSEDPSHNDVGRSHSARKEEKTRAVGYAVAKVWGEIVRTRLGMEPPCFAQSTQDVINIITMASDDEREEMEYLVGNFKPTDEPTTMYTTRCMTVYLGVTGQQTSGK